MADPLKAIADHAHQVQSHAAALSRALGSQGAEEASKFFEQCSQAAGEVVQQVPAAPGKEAAPEERQGAPENQGPPPEEQEAADVKEAAAQGGAGDRTPYAEGARDITRQAKTRR